MNVNTDELLEALDKEQIIVYKKGYDLDNSKRQVKISTGD